ncbi:MAG: hypothetical protein LKJ50_08610 [Clostridiales bacterium]|jgi:hypothetical protein|nr:hypothetical protein [Clostridiales bacterium]MCI2160407.1 hypothetical protein [Oscillospiraceae bacterium]MCI1961824.1 hypothetical protein [Clostridiales bacterium]MCI2022443.1 hypothetical protein [Clostridiales bacterium]MCI2026840.1 hypothetical protein [Clostridiales bacterium]
MPKQKKSGAKPRIKSKSAATQKHNGNPFEGFIDACDRVLIHYAMKKKAADNPANKTEPTGGDWGYAIRDFIAIDGIMVILVLVSLRNVGVDQIFPIVMGILLVILFTLGIFRMRILRRKSLEKDSEDDHPN